MHFDEMERRLARFVKPSSGFLEKSIPESEGHTLKILSGLDLEKIDVKRYDSALDEALNWVNPSEYRFILRCIIQSYYRDGQKLSSTIETILYDLGGSPSSSQDCNLWPDPFGPRWNGLSEDEIQVIRDWILEIKEQVSSEGKLKEYFDETEVSDALRTLDFLKTQGGRNPTIEL